MIKKLLLIALLILPTLAYEIIIDKTSIAPKMDKESTFTRDSLKEIVTERATGLMWQDDDTAKSVEKDWEGAKEYCQDLTHGGYGDWHLPTISELESLLDYSKDNPAMKDGFKNVVSGFYWSSSPDISNSTAAWRVYFNGGYSRSSKKASKFCVRCARMGQ